MDTISIIYKVTVPQGYESMYIDFSARLDAYIRKLFGKYYICDEIYQTRTNPTEFYTIAFYRDLAGLESTFAQIAVIVSAMYQEEFGDLVQREAVVTPTFSKKVYPCCC